MGKNAWKLFYSQFEQQPAGDFLGKSLTAGKVNITIEPAAAAESADNLMLTGVKSNFSTLVPFTADHSRM